MSENNLPPAIFQIKKIKEIAFFINEDLFEVNKQVRIQFQHYTLYYPQTDFVQLTFRVLYSYNTSMPQDAILMDFHVQNTFEVPNLKNYSVNNEFILPQNLIISLVSVSISHTRALMARNIAGTLYQENILPITNPIEVAKAFYPNMFLEQEQVPAKVISSRVVKSRKTKVK